MGEGDSIRLKRHEDLANMKKYEAPSIHLGGMKKSGRNGENMIMKESVKEGFYNEDCILHSFR